jgi:hypothetical protein
MGDLAKKIGSIDEVYHQKRDGLRSKRIVMDVRNARSSFGPLLTRQSNRAEAVTRSGRSRVLGLCWDLFLAGDGGGRIFTLGGCVGKILRCTLTLIAFRLRTCLEDAVAWMNARKV